MFNFDHNQNIREELNQIDYVVQYLNWYCTVTI